jgi:hypothetical protein
MTTYTKPAPKPKRTRTKASKAKCIALSGKIVTHDGKCCTCTNVRSGKLAIYPSHIVSRRYARTAARTDNQLPQCEWCATFYTDNPELWKAFVDEKYPGRRTMLESVARSQPGVDMQWDAVYDGLIDEAKVAGII